MKRAVRFALLLAAVSPVWAQKDLTTFQQLFTGQIIVPIASASVRNIGQAAHTAYILFANRPAQVCAAGAADMGFESSYNGTTWTRFGEQMVAIALNSDGQLSATLNAYGAYPQVRFKIRAFDAFDCQVSVWYSGSVAGQANINLTAGAMTVTNTPNVRPLSTLSYTVDYDSGLVAVPNAATTLTAADTLVYSIYCNNKSAAAVSLSITNAAATVEYVSSGYTLPAYAFGTLFDLARGQKFAGLRWTAGAATAIYCQVVGMQQ